MSSELRNGTGFVGRRIPTVLAPSLSAGLRRFWLADALLLGFLGVAAVAMAAVGLGQGLSPAMALSVGGVGVLLLLGADWLRRLLANDAALRASLSGAWGRWADLGGRRMGASDLAGLNVTPWGILNRSDVRVLLRQAAMVVPDGRAVTVIDLAEAMARLTLTGGRAAAGSTSGTMGADGERTASTTVVAGGATEAQIGRGASATTRVFMVLAGLLGAVILGVFGWRLVANAIQGDVTGTVWSAVIAALGLYLVVKGLSFRAGRTRS